MRTHTVLGAALAAVLYAPYAVADEQLPPPEDPAAATSPEVAPLPAAPAAPTEAAQPPPSSPPPAPPPGRLGEDAPPEPPRSASTIRDDGLRLGLELAFARAAGSAEEALNAGSPSLIPLAADASMRVSQKVLLGIHGFAALASREDCPTSQSCTARGYGAGAHVETALGRNGSMLPWFRYGIGWEMLYRGGLSGTTEGAAYRHALDLLDARLGFDFVVGRGAEGRTTRIGPFVGMVAGVLLGQSGEFKIGPNQYDFDRGGGDAHFWFSIGFRGTTDL